MMNKNLDKQKIQSNIIKWISLRYVLAVGFIAIFTIGTFLFNQNQHDQRDKDFQAINVSGRQRMLSQRIALLANRNDLDAMKATISEFEEGYQFLLSTRFISKNYPELQKLYKKPFGIEHSLKRLKTLTDAPGVKENQELIFSTSQVALNQFDLSTSLIQKISEEDFARRLLIEVILMMSTLFLLALVVIFIFQPTINKIREAFELNNKIEDQALNNARLAMIGEAASSVGHEISSPLMVISATAENLLRNKSATLDDNQTRKLTTIVKHTDRIKRLLNALKNQARQTSQDRMNPVPPSKIIEDAVEMFDARLQQENIKLFINEFLDSDINCKAAAISQVVANLISNAIDALSETITTEPKEIVIETGIEKDQKFIRVSDNGPGVPASMEESIFESFITTKPQGKGTGLGLSISKKIMHDHGGDLKLNTAISRSCFEITFPN